ncbi:MAG: hypothetical protein GEU71_18570 [Actinobacteria bacterium]|nr:hypothetical protein [Actinomycetota bacterium]
MSRNLGKVQLSAGLSIDSTGNARTLDGAASTQKDGKPSFNNGVFIFASTNSALSVRGEVKDAAIDLWQPNGNIQKIKWRLKRDPWAVSTLHADPETGNFVFSVGGHDIEESGHIDHRQRGSINLQGLSATSTPAHNLRGINKPVEAGDTSHEVPFATPEATDEYAVMVECDWLTLKAVKKWKNPQDPNDQRSWGFTIRFDQPPPAGGGKVDWFLVR